MHAVYNMWLLSLGLFVVFPSRHEAAYCDSYSWISGIWLLHENDVNHVHQATWQPCYDTSLLLGYYEQSLNISGYLDICNAFTFYLCIKQVSFIDKGKKQSLIHSTRAQPGLEAAMAVPWTVIKKTNFYQLRCTLLQRWTEKDFKPVKESNCYWMLVGYPSRPWEKLAAVNFAKWRQRLYRWRQRVW